MSSYIKFRLWKRAKKKTSKWQMVSKMQYKAYIQFLIDTYTALCC